MSEAEKQFRGNLRELHTILNGCITKANENPNKVSSVDEETLNAFGTWRKAMYESKVNHNKFHEWASVQANEDPTPVEYNWYLLMILELGEREFGKR